MVIWCFGMAGGLKDSATGITDGEKVIILDSLATNKQMNAVLKVVKANGVALQKLNNRVARLEQDMTDFKSVVVDNKFILTK